MQVIDPPITSLTELSLYQKRVLIRQDFNIPITDGKIRSEARILAALPSIEYAVSQQAAVILLSHLGRPTEATENLKFSLEPVAKSLAYHLKKPVRFFKNWLEGVPIQAGEIALCENVRFQKGEINNDPALAQKMARLGDIFIMDAFAVAHRAAASTVGITHYIPQACAGLLLQAELENLTKALNHPKRPLVALVGGAKISTKLQLLESLIMRVDSLLLGGGIAHTFLAANGQAIGNSLFEPSLVPEAKRLLDVAAKKQCNILLPQDGITSQAIDSSLSSHKALSDITAHDQIFDLGPHSAKCYADCLQSAGTILWNGPVGVFEQTLFQQGTATIAQAISQSNAFSIAGGGDTLAAIELYGITNQISYISTGGGAFLAFLENKPLVAVQALQNKSQNAYFQ